MMMYGEKYSAIAIIAIAVFSGSFFIGIYLLTEKPRSNGAVVTIPTKSSEQKDRAPILVRCSWGSSLIDRDDHPEHPSKKSNKFSIRMCSSDFCKGEPSNEAYNDFLFNEAVSVESGYKNKTEAFDRFINSNASCHFLEQHENTLCTCEYYSFVEYCNRVFSDDNVEISFLGDSTSGRFQKNVDGACKEIMSKSTLMKPTSSENNKMGHHIVVVNESTLHKLYLPFSREKDVPGGNFHPNPPLSVNDFLQNIDNHLQHLLDVHSTTDNTIFVYMSNNDVCHDLYNGKYFESTRFLLEDPDPIELETVMKRRGADVVTTLGLTLDHYGSTFARKLAYLYVKEHFPQYLILTLAAKYPSNCILSKKGDGRHFSKPTLGVHSFYTIKARLLLHMIIDKISLDPTL